MEDYPLYTDLMGTFMALRKPLCRVKKVLSQVKSSQTLKVTRTTVAFEYATIPPIFDTCGFGLSVKNSIGSLKT